MPNYVQLSRYYLDDKDLQDIVEGAPIKSRFLVEFLRKRGIFVPEPSKNWPRSALIRLFVRQPLAWSDIQLIGKGINSTDRGEKSAACKLGGVAKDLDLDQIYAQVQEQRSSKKAESYNVTKKADGSTALRVSYTEVDPHQARPFQKRERTVEIEVQRQGEDLVIRHSSNERATQIVEVLSGMIAEKAPDVATRKRIEFPGLRDAALRTEFFTTLLEKVSGFRVLDVVDVKVGNQLENDSEEHEEEDSDEEDEDQADQGAAQAQVIKGLIKRAAFSGSSILTSEIYQELRQTGYFLTSLKWKAHDGSADHEVEFCAEMVDTCRFCDFRFDVVNVSSLSPDQESFQVSKSDFKRRYTNRLEEAAFSAKDAVDKKIAKLQSGDGKNEKVS